MKYRKLRIAWSVAWGVVAVLLLVLWVRSYSVQDFCEWSSSTKNYGVFSGCGRFSLQRTDFVVMQFDFHFGQLPAREGMNYSSDAWLLGMRLSTWEFGWLAGVSYAWILLIVGVVAMLPWFPWSNRFSLRTLLIATTLVAVVLGLIVWLL